MNNLNMTLIKNMFLPLFLAGFLLITALPNVAQAQSRISEIRVQGTERIEPATVLSYMDVRVGDDLTANALDNALKSLFASGLFADVSVGADGGALVVNVVENPIINQVAFEGNEDIDDNELQAEIQLRPRQVFTRTKVQEDITRLYQIYRRNGRFSADIDPKVIKLDQNRVDLVFEIDEGAVTRIRTIRFVGNEHYDDDRLRSEISTKENRWYRFFSSADRYDPDRLAFDQELLRRFYLSEGYADFQISSAVAELSKDKDHFFVTMTLEEGARYKVGEIAINSAIRNFDASALTSSVTIKKGEWYNADEVKRTIDEMTDALGDLQYAFVEVRPEINRNRDAQTVDIAFNISETPPVFVERINVSGNSRTLDKVVRRELLLVEGDPFNKSKLARSEQEIRNLDFFETIDVITKPGSAPDKTAIDVNVREKSTGDLSVGAGFSTADGPLADFRIRERNFMGKGQDVVLASTIAGKRTEFDFSFTEPYFLGRDLSAGVDAFHITRDLQDESSFDQQRSGAGLRVGYPLSEFWRQTLRVRGETNEITDVDATASRFIRDQEGTRDTIAFSQRLVYDVRDSKIFPTDGMMFWFDTEVTGLGGDSKYISGVTGASYFIPVTDSVVLNFLGEVGAIEGYGDENVTINERFYMGGSDLRGFEKSGVGPRDISTDDALGGNRFYRGSIEASFPVGLAEELGVKGHAFTDFGSLFEIDEASDPALRDESSIRASAGVGLSWRSPFGPLRVNLAVPYSDEDFDQDEVFSFNFGTRF